MTIYYHKHHIVPKHAGGTDDPTNIVHLTIEEHAEAHRVLFETYGRWQDNAAYTGLLKIYSKEDHHKIIARNSGMKTVDLQVGIHDPERKNLRSLGGKNSITKLKTFIKKSKWVTNGLVDTRILETHVRIFLAEKKTWRLGRTFGPNRGKKNQTKNLYWVRKKSSRKRVSQEDLDYYIKLGWSRGM